MDTQQQPSEVTTSPSIEPTPETKFKKPSPKLITTVIVLLVLAALAYNYRSLFVAATVDGSIISRLKVLQKLEQQNGKTVLDSLIDDQLVNNAAKKNNVTASVEEINKKLNDIKTQIESQGGSLDAALTGAGITMDDLKKQIDLQVKLEKLLGDKITVTDEEVSKFITDNKLPVEAGKEEETKNQVREQLKSQKLSQEFNKYMEELRTSAKINTYVQY